MKTTLINIAIAITTISAATSFYLATLPELNEVQAEVAKTANIVVVSGTTTIFGLVDNDKEPEQ